jgi:tRNA dimethylallyltransferase
MMMKIQALGTMMTKPVTKNQDKILIVITGPTAVGKTALAIRLAQHFATEIISADSRQFYRELKIGTAAPTLDELQKVPHHFIGNLSLDQYYNVSMFEYDALNVLEKIFQKQNVAIISGGSGLYIDAVCHGIDEMPDIDPKVREMINKRFQSEGIDYLRSYLEKADSEYFAIVDKNNPNRMKRAVEVCMSTGKTFTSFRKRAEKRRSFTIVRAGLNLPRAELHTKISRRTDLMIAQGLIEEVTSLLPYRHLNALNTVGYKEIFDFLDKKVTLEHAIAKIKTNTRRYARRQLTWLNRYKDLQWFAPDDDNEIVQFVDHTIQKHR